MKEENRAGLRTETHNIVDLEALLVFLLKGKGADFGFLHGHFNASVLAGRAQKVWQTCSWGGVGGRARGALL